MPFFSIVIALAAVEVIVPELILTVPLLSIPILLLTEVNTVVPFILTIPALYECTKLFPVEIPSFT